MNNGPRDIDSYSEDDVIEHLILPLLKKLGYDISDKNEISRQHDIPVGRTHVYPDIVVVRKGSPSFVIDGKNPRENLDDYTTQILSYGTLLKVKYGVLCNGRELRCYNIATEKIIWNKSMSDVPTFLSKENMAKTRSSRISEERTKKAEKVLLQIEGIRQFSKLLHKCEDVIRDNDGLTGETAFDQMTIILFMKMWYERTNPEIFSLPHIRSAGGARYVKEYLFDQVRKEGGSDLIDKTESILLSDTTIMQILEYFEDYTLLGTDVDVKGKAFEIFLGRTLTGKLGQFFTPRTVVEFMVNLVEPKINSRHKEPYMVLDPCCGTGGFLIYAFRHMCKKIHSMPKWDADTLARRLAESQLFGMDINPRLARVAKMNMFLHGDGHGGIHSNNGLVDPDGDSYNDRFDLVITNPPFGNEETDDNILQLFELGSRKKTAREILFIERCIKCLKADGILAIVLPDGILNSPRKSYVRDFIATHTVIDAVISLPTKSFKAVGANSKTSIMFLRKKSAQDDDPQMIFMAMAEEIGFERKTKLAKEIRQNDLDAILQTYKESAGLRKADTDIKKIRDSPSCFLINPNLVSKRIDASYFHAEHIFELNRPSCRVEDVAVSGRVDINLDKEPKRELEYIEYSSIDKHAGTITHTTPYTGETAPGRAQRMVSVGDVICAKMLDSEKNVAIVPESLDGEVASNGFVVLKAVPPMTPESLLVALRMNSTTEQVRWRATGTIMPVIDDEDYMNIKVPKFTAKQIEEYTKKIAEYDRIASERKSYLSRVFAT